METRNLQIQGDWPSSGIQFGPEPTENSQTTIWSRLFLLPKHTDRWNKSDLRDCEMERCCGHVETNCEGESTTKDSCGLRQAVRLAQEVGEGLGRGQVLLGEVPEAAEVVSS